MSFLKNVLGFKKMYDGEAFNTLTRELKDLGYDFVPPFLRLSDYGLPQKRQRTIIVGWKAHLNPVLLPLPTHTATPDFFGGSPKKIIDGGTL